MSDGPATPQEQYYSQVDPAFSAAFNLVHAKEEPTEAGTSEDAADAAGAGDETPATAGEGAAAEGAATQTPAGGAESKLPSAADLIAATLPDRGEPTGTVEPARAGVPVADVGDGLDPAEVTPLFGAAFDSINTRMESTFKAQAFQELESEIDEQFLTALRQPAMRLVGQEVPSVRLGAPADEMTKILDTQMARDWQQTVASIIEEEVNDKVQQKIDTVRPMTSVIQESALLFQNNPDLIIGTKGFDSELAERFTRLAQAYEVKTAKGVIGYGVNVQPLINELRSGLSKERGASGARAEDRVVAQRAAAAAQPRTESGKFDSPQAGISSKSGMSGDPGDDYSAFWSATGLAPNLTL